MKKILAVFLTMILVFTAITGVTVVGSAAEITYGNDVDLNAEELEPDYEPEEEPDLGPLEVALEEVNGIKGGYIEENSNGYTAVAYEFSTFLGWYDAEGELISTTPFVSATAGGYHGARFNTENLIKDSGFDNFETGTKIYDHTSTEKQPWTTHYMTRAEALTAFGSNYADGTYKVSGKNSMRMQPPYQNVSTAVTLQPNTEYYVSMKFAHTTQNPATFLSSVVFGILYLDYDANTMPALTLDSVKTVTPGTALAQGVWTAESFVFKTGDTIPENTVFAYRFSVAATDPTLTDGVKNDTRLYVDDVVVIPFENHKAAVTVSSKNSATLVPEAGHDTDYALIGKDYCFTVVTEPGLTPTVTANGTVVTPNAEGVYSVPVTGDLAFNISCGDDDVNRPDSGKDNFGRDLTAYNADVYLENIWEGDTVYQETAMFAAGRDTIRLLYPVDEIVSFRSYSLKTTYIEGVDFEITPDGCIKRLEGSRIPVYAGALTTTEKPATNAFPTREDPNLYLKAIGDTEYPLYAVSVTYKHSKVFEDGYQPTAPIAQNKAFKDVLEKLENGEQVNIVVLGDSISCGWSSSGVGGTECIGYDNTTITQITYSAEPYAPTWIEMVMTTLEKKYPGQIAFKNLSLGGRNSSWGAQNIAARLVHFKDENGNQLVPDLIMVGFGVNDRAGNLSAANFKKNMKAIADNARSAVNNPDMAVLYYAPMLPNQKTTSWDKTLMLEYEDALAELADEGQNTGVLRLTSIFEQIIKSKDPLDYLNTYWNHGNDFTARMYATGILEVLLGDSPVVDAPEVEFKTYNTVTLKKVDGVEYSLDGESWQTSNVFAGLKEQTEYTFFSRYAETSTTLAGAASSATAVTTLAKPEAQFIPGNVDGDANGNVNLQDVVALAQVVAGWEDVQHVEAALDVNGDGDVNLQDVVHLAQYVAGWDVTLAEKTTDIEVDVGPLL